LAFRFSRPSKARRELNDHALVASDTEAQDDESFRLLPWNGGSRLFSLRIMTEFWAPRLINAFKSIANCFRRKDEPIEESRSKISEHLRELRAESVYLGMRSTTIYVDRMLEAVKTASRQEIEHRLDVLNERFNDDTNDIMLFYVPHERLSFYNRTDLFGDEFKQKFPVANAEITEAGNCLAFDRFTGCVFHLMRSLEIALRVLFSALNLPPITSAGARNWNGLLKEIRAKLDMDKSIPEWEFYDGAYAFLAAAKNPMRNSTMHVDVTYSDEDSVRSVWLGSEAFMRHLATRLKE
jgi:hypothetical protein